MGEIEGEKNFYCGKPDMLPSWNGGGWGGPKEGNDTDERFMLRGEARELPDYLYKSWKDHNRVKNIIEDKMSGRMKFNATLIAALPGSDSDHDEEWMPKKVKKKKEKDK